MNTRQVRKSAWIVGALSFVATLAGTWNAPAEAEVVNCAECEMLRVSGLGNQTLQDFLGAPGAGSVGALGTADRAVSRYLVQPRNALAWPNQAPFLGFPGASSTPNWDVGQELPGANLIPTLPWRQTDFNPTMIAPFYNARDGVLFDHPSAPWNVIQFPWTTGRLYPVGHVLL